jgi:NitT/TauT family transport system permease protein
MPYNREAAVQDTLASTDSGGDALRQLVTRMSAQVRQSRSRSGKLVWLIRLGVVAVVVGAWQLATTLGVVDTFFVSSPVAVLAKLYKLLFTAALWSDVWATFAAALVAVVIGSALGIGMAVIFWKSPLLNTALDPYLTLFNAMPRPALAPIFILWFGLGITPKVCAAITLVFFLVLLNTRAGLAGINPDTVLLANSLGIRPWRRFRLVELPAALPSVVAGLRLGVVYAVLGVVVSEMVASYNGLGQTLVKATNAFDMSTSFGVIILMAVLALVLDLGVGKFEKYVRRGRRER